MRSRRAAHLKAYHVKQQSVPWYRARRLLYAAGRRAGMNLQHLRACVEGQLYHNRCKICGLPFDMLAKIPDLGPSLDRRDNRQGYTQSNTQVVHFACNRIKGTFDEAAVKPLIKQIMWRVYAGIFKGKFDRIGKNAIWAA